MRLRTPLAALLVLWAASETGLSLNPCSLCSAGLGAAFQMPMFPLPSVDNAVYLPPESAKVCSVEMRRWVETMINQPNYMPFVMEAFMKLGIAFKRFKDTINSLVIRGTQVNLPRPVPVKYKVPINNQVFYLPQEADKITAYLSRNPDQLAVVIPTLRGIGATFTMTGGMVSGFTLFSVVYKFKRPLGTKISVEGKNFKIPKDMKMLITFLVTKPKVVLRLQVVLEVFGVNTTKAEGDKLQLRYQKEPPKIVEVPSARIKLAGRHYSIPADLHAIFENPETLHVGELFEALQRANIDLQLNHKTGVVVGIKVKGTPVPFPLNIDLRFKWNNRVYQIPRDMKALIAQLQVKGMPSDVIHVLYTRFGVRQVRDSAGIVVKLSFFGILYAIKVERQTAVTILKKKFYLPRDVKKMVAFVRVDEKRIILMLQALQRAGFMFIPETDGFLRTIQKGAQMITLDMKLKIMVNFLDTWYRMPFDLPTLVKDIRGLARGHYKDVLRQFKQSGVKVTKKGSKIHIVFNSIKYTL